MRTAVFALGLTFRAGWMVLFGGYLIARRNAMARLCARDAAAIMLAWALITAVVDHLPYAFELLPMVMFVAVMVTGLRARGGAPAGPLRTLRACREGGAALREGGAAGGA
jgi:hypothetical protein